MKKITGIFNTPSEVKELLNQSDNIQDMISVLRDRYEVEQSSILKYIDMEETDETRKTAVRDLFLVYSDEMYMELMKNHDLMRKAVYTVLVNPYEMQDTDFLFDQKILSIKIGMKVVGQLYEGACCGNADSKRMLVKIFQAAYPEEYNILKRYRTITSDDLYNLTCDGEGMFFPGQLARQIVMSLAMDIEFDYEQELPTLKFVCGCKRQQVEHQKKENKINKVTKSKCEQEVELKLSDPVPINGQTQWFAKLLRLEGKSGSVIHTMSWDEIRDSAVDFLYARRAAHQRMEYDSETLQTFGILTFIIKQLCNAQDSVFELLEDIVPDKYKMSAEMQIQDDHIALNDHDKQKEQDITEQEGSSADGSWKEQYQDLKRRYDHLSVLYNDLKEKCHEAEKEMPASESNEAPEELSEEPVSTAAAAAISYEDAKKCLAEKKIVLVGGNDNWTNKLKLMFPKWTFISGVSSSSSDFIPIRTADLTVLFTDTIGHSVYGKAIQMVRDGELPYMYLKGVNLEKNVMDIWEKLAVT